MADFKWTDEKTEELIAMFECRPWLFDITMKEYSNRDKKKKSMEEIANHFGVSGKFLIRVCRKINCVYLHFLSFFY